MTNELLINIDWAKASYTGIRTNNKEYLLSYLSGWTRQFPMVITMPCGAEVTFNAESDLPENSMPCSCGRSDHWFIKYTDEEIG